MIMRITNPRYVYVAFAQISFAQVSSSLYTTDFNNLSLILAIMIIVRNSARLIYDLDIFSQPCGLLQI